MLNRWIVTTVAALALAAPTAALAASGYATSTVNMRAGPGTEYPVVDTIPAGAHVDIHGCLDDHSWCDVSWSSDHGWVSAAYLDYLYRNQYVYLPDYVDVIGVPIVSFSLGSYWADYYTGRPWYHRLAYWQNFWRAHGRYGYARNENAAPNRGHARNFETGNQGRFVQGPRSPHELARTGVNPGTVGRQYRGERQHVVGGEYANHFRGPSVVHRAPSFGGGGPHFGRTAGGLSAHASAGAVHMGGPGFAHGGGGGGPHFAGGGAPHGGGGGGGNHRR
jgi:uncharacterized protein YraI